MPKLAAYLSLAIATFASTSTLGCATETSDEGDEVVDESGDAIRRGTSGQAGDPVAVAEIARALREEGIASAVIPKMVCTAYYESGWKDRSWNARNGDGTVDRGLFQINSVHIKAAYRTKAGRDVPKGLCADMTEEDLWEPRKNIECAARIYGEQGITAWAAYTAHRRTVNDGPYRRLGCDVYKLGDTIDTLR